MRPLNDNLNTKIPYLQDVNRTLLSISIYRLFESIKFIPEMEFV